METDDCDYDCGYYRDYDYDCDCRRRCDYDYDDYSATRLWRRKRRGRKLAVEGDEVAEEGVAVEADDHPYEGEEEG